MQHWQTTHQWSPHDVLNNLQDDPFVHMTSIWYVHGAFDPKRPHVLSRNLSKSINLCVHCDQNALNDFTYHINWSQIEALQCWNRNTTNTHRARLQARKLA
jgi:hypothetical protein